MRVRFGDWVFDSDARELARAGEAAHLSPKAIDFLALLLAHRPRAVAKAEIMEKLWPDTFVSDASLSSLAAEVRSVLGDDSRSPRYLRTVYGFGYAFCGAAETPAYHAVAGAAGLPHCRLRWGKREIPLAQGENVLGRTDDAVVWIESSSVSRRHARIVVAEGHATLEDLGSKNGTFLGTERLTTPRELRDGDQVRLGAVLMTFRAFQADTTSSLNRG
jgi:DNA-binding winged helix-turn-helix (wHTH) protein